MKTIYNCFILSILSIALFSSCDKTERYEPGPQTDANSMQVYFHADNVRSVTLLPDDTFEVVLKMGREKSESAASVPITVLGKDDVINIPSTVEFAAGEATADLVITFPSAELKTIYSYSITIEGSQFIDAYSHLDGSFKFVGEVTVSDWELFAENVLFKPDAIFSSWRQNIYKMGGVNLYKIDDYMNSGYDLQFSIDPGNGYLTMKDGYLSGGYYWYIYDSNGYVPLYPAGSDVHITSCFFYMGGYTKISISSRTGTLYHYNYMSDGESGYNAVSLSW